MPVVSIIIPVFNTEKYLPACLESAAAQTLSDIEVIVIDDGSTDSSSRICDEFGARDRRFRVIHGSNQGQGAARNIGVDIARGDYLTFLDSDDSLLPNFCEILTSRAEEDACDFVECGYSTIDGIRKVNYLFHPGGKAYSNASELLDEYLRGGAITTGPCASIYRRQLFDTLRFSSLRSREDIDLLYRVFACVGKAAYVPDCLYVQHIRMGSIERSGFDEGKLETLRILADLKSFVAGSYPELKEALLIKEVSELNFILNEIPSDHFRGRSSVIQQITDDLADAIDALGDLGVDVSREDALAILDWPCFVKEHRERERRQRAKDSLRRALQKRVEPGFFIYEKTVVS